MNLNPLNLLHSLRHFFRTMWKKLSRKLLHWRMSSSDQQARFAAERKLRGKEQYKTLQKADIVVVSFGKSGRTWLRVMISHVFRLMYQLPANLIIGFDNFHNLNRSVPKIFFTHDNYIKDFTGEPGSKAPFYGKKVVLLARDPRDVTVSNYFQWKFRMKPEKKIINDYPPAGSDIGLYDYMFSDHGGSLADVTNFMNIWADEAASVQQFHLVRYEDLRSNTAETLRKLLDFMAVAASDQQVQDAVEFSSYDNMKKMEQKNTFWLSGGRMAPGDKDNPDSYKVRKAKVGGYRDYFEDPEIAEVDRYVSDKLDASFGYSKHGEAA